MLAQFDFQKHFYFKPIQFSQKVLIQTIQFCISMQLVLFNPWIGPYQVLPFRAKVDLGAMAMKGLSAFPKAPASLEPHHQIVLCHIQDTHGGSYPSAEVQSVYSTTPANWTIVEQ